MPDLKLVRKTVSNDDTKEKIGYNFYLFFYKDEKKEKESLIYSSIGRTEPTNEMFHNAEAQIIFNNIKTEVEKENIKEDLSLKKLRIS